MGATHAPRRHASHPSPPRKRGSRASGAADALDSRFRAGLSGEPKRVGLEGRVTTIDTPWPGLTRPPTSASTAKLAPGRTWMPGTSPGKGTFLSQRRCEDAETAPSEFPRTGLRFRGGDDRR